MNEHNEIQIRRDNMKTSGVRIINFIKQNNKKTLFLFDIDGTLTPARQPIKNNMIEFLNKLSNHFDLAAVGGSDLPKLKEQLGPSMRNF